MPPTPINPTAALRQIDRLTRAADFAAAIAQAQRLLKAKPALAQARMALARAFEGAGRFDDAIAELEQLAAGIADPKQAQLPRRALGDLLVRTGRGDRAIEVFDAGLRALPDAEPLIAGKVSALIELGRLDDAWALLAPRFESGRPAPELAALRARLRQRRGEAGDGADELREYMQSVSGLPPMIRRILLARLGELLDRAQDYDAAFAAFTEAASLAPSGFNPDAHDAQTDAMIRAWSSDAMSKAVRAPERDTRPVFIVGIPRSGTSLVERIIGAHPKASAGGETNILPEAWRSVVAPLPKAGAAPDPARITLKAIASSASTARARFDRIDASAERIVDKNQLNALRLGLIPLLLPGARVVHCLRDPRDTCLSNYFQQFESGLAYASDLAHAGRFYVSYRRLMDHWQRTLDLPIHEIRLDKLVSDPETQVRSLLKFLDLDWDERCLRPQDSGVTTWTASRDQTSSPINASGIDRWKNYQSHLGPLLEALGPYAQGVDPISA